MPEKTMLLIFNPTAGQGNFRDSIFPVIDLFTKEGFLVTIYPTQAKRDAFSITLRQGGNYNYLVCSGGDGTLNEAVDALMLLPKKPVFGYIPSGTTNDFAHTLGLPSDALLAAETICNGRLQAIDIGRFGDEYFSYVAAFGLFTDVSYGTPQNMKNMLGHAAYVLEGVKRLANIKSYSCTIVCDGEVIEGDFTFGMVTNSQTVGGFALPIKREHWQGDGMFELVLLKKIRRFAQLQDVISVLLGMSDSSQCDSLLVRTAKDIEVICDIPLDWTMDGEFAGSHQSAKIHICQQPISIMVPEE